MLGLSTGLSLGSYVGGKLDEVKAFKQEVLNLNADNERIKFSEVDPETNEPVTVEIQPTDTFEQDYMNRHCRSYDYAYTKNGENSHGRGYACLKEQGIWHELHHQNG